MINNYLMTSSLKICDFNIGRTLGTGSYGKVKRKFLFAIFIGGINLLTGETVAIKILNKRKIKQLGMCD